MIPFENLTPEVLRFDAKICPVHHHRQRVEDVAFHDATAGRRTPRRGGFHHEGSYRRGKEPRGFPKVLEVYLGIQNTCKKKPETTSISYQKYLRISM